MIRIFLVLVTFSLSAMAQQGQQSLQGYENCQRTGSYFFGKVYQDAHGKILSKNFTSSTNCLNESGQYQRQQGQSPCREDEVLETWGWHFANGQIAGELRYHCLSKEEFLEIK